MNKKMKIFVIKLFALAALLNLNYNVLLAHCEIPCGIYDDSLRVQLIYEHITTIEKSMNQINELSKSDEVNYNQLFRWIDNKEEHALKIQEIVSQYFLHQRIIIINSENAEAYKKYHNMLELLHKMLIYSMKAKQTTELKYITLLRETLHSFENLYFHNH